jgi:YD repeat-containing protein
VCRSSPVRRSTAGSVQLVGLLVLGPCVAASDLHAERYQYEAPGRLVRVVYDDLSSIAYTYDPNGNITAVGVTAAGIPGDADGDGNVDLNDVELIAQTSLAGGEPYSPTADCNLDDVVSVLDVVCALGAGAPGIGGSPLITGGEVDAMRGDGVEVAISISGVGGIARAFELDLSYDPAVVSLGPVSSGTAFGDHVLLSSSPAAGSLRLLG